MITRCEFLVGVAEAGVLRAARYEPKLISQPYVWTQVLQKEKIALADGLDRMFGESKRAGYNRIELMDAFQTPELRSRTADLVRKYDFEVPVVLPGTNQNRPTAASRIFCKQRTARAISTPNGSTPTAIRKRGTSARASWNWPPKPGI